MELLLNLIVWIGLLSWDQCCFNKRLIKGQDGDPVAPNLAGQPPGPRAAPVCPRGPGISASALCNWPYDPDADKNSVSDPNEASPLLYPTPKAMPTHPGRGQRNRPKPFSQYAESFSLPDDIRLRRTFKRRQTTFLNFWFLSIFQVFSNNTGHKEFDFRDKHIRCDTQSTQCSYLT